MKRLIAVLVVLGSTFAIHPAQAATNPPACSVGYVNVSFDDSPTQSTPAYLAALKANGLHATFFDVGDRMAQFPTYAKAQLTAGMQIGNHTQSHMDLTASSSSDWDLVQTQYLLVQQTGQVPVFYRPPYGATNTTVSSKALQDLHLTEVIWTVDPNDWASPSTASIVASATTVQPGGFILMHDGYPNTQNAIPGIASMLKSRGLCAGKIVTSSTPTQAWEGLSFDATVNKF